MKSACVGVLSITINYIFPSGRETKFHTHTQNTETRISRSW